VILVWIGALVATTGAWLTLTGRSGFVLAGYYTYFGYGLIGILFLDLNWQVRQMGV
jgi:hypothetical protein